MLLILTVRTSPNTWVHVREMEQEHRDVCREKSDSMAKVEEELRRAWRLGVFLLQ
jgi:hypothetical protein